MKDLLLSGALVLWGTLPNAQAQTSYGKAYTNADGSAKLVELEEGKTLVSMGRGPALTKLDGMGEMIWTVWKWGNGTQPIYYPLCVAKLSESSFYSVGGYQSSGFQPVLCRLSSSGDILEAKRYLISNALMPFAKDVAVTADGGAVIWSRRDFSGFFILKAQPDLACQWSHFYNSIGSFQFVRELPGGDLLAGLNMDTAGAAVARLDANGNLLWCKSYIRPKGVVHDAVVESDSSFVITGFTDSTASQNAPPGYDPRLFLMKLNGAGEVQWCKSYDGTDLWYASRGQHIVHASDNGYVLMAQAGGKPVLLKTNENGDTLWTRTTNTPAYHYTAIDMIGREDGGYMMSMGVIGGELNGPALMKTDALGHFPCGDRSYPVQVLDLFPVDSAFTLVPASSGATAYPVTFRDTVFDPMVPYDLCDIVTTVPEPRRSSRAIIHPNPNTGRFTVEFDDPLTVDSFYSVYNAVGQLLFQRPLAKGQVSEEIDLSRFAKGTYLVRVSDRNGVCYERVVVQ
ncbi:MAG: T9SS type A sorting domain-containing protein [Flavobacteriales bacterium]|nr:T9SS type A sorting domain-containing protein [Flavobacteriales bacterium]